MYNYDRPTFPDTQFTLTEFYNHVAKCEGISRPIPKTKRQEWKEYLESLLSKKCPSFHTVLRKHGNKYGPPYHYVQSTIPVIRSISEKGIMMRWGTMYSDDEINIEEAPIDYTCCYGYTLLHYLMSECIRSSHESYPYYLQGIKRLIERGADPYSTGTLPTHLTPFGRYLSYVRLGEYDPVVDADIEKIFGIEYNKVVWALPYDYRSRTQEYDSRSEKFMGDAGMLFGGQYTKDVTALLDLVHDEHKDEVKRLHVALTNQIDTTRLPELADKMVVVDEWGDVHNPPTDQHYFYTVLKYTGEPDDTPN